jgi:hypothetical protein
MMNFCDKLRDDMRKEHGDGLLSVTIEYADRYYTGQVRKLEDSIQYFSKDDYDGMDTDPEEYHSFIVNFIPITNKPKGGNDNLNDCLINCIKKALPTQKDKIDADEIKAYLNINREEKIHLSLIPKLEKHLNFLLKSSTGNEVAINVSGEYSYKSKIKTAKSIDVIMSNEHYTLNEENLPKRKGFSHKERKLIVHDGEQCYDGSKYFDFDQEEYRKTMVKPESAKYLYISKRWIIRNIKKAYKDIPLKEAFDLYEDMADLLKGQNELLNLYKTDLKNLALNNFYAKVTTLHPDPISNNEAQYLEEASFSALTYWERYEGEAHTYDINSHYPYLMSLKGHYFPIKEGEYINVQEINPQEFGIYRCIISNPTNKKCKLFTFNKSNHYTSIDVEHALKYGLTVELIQDDQPNFLYYSKDKLVNGHYMFSKYIKEKFQLKLNKFEGAKLLLNILWGALSETNSDKHTISCQTPFELTDCKIVGLGFNGSSVETKVIPYRKHYYATKFARIKPFILSYGRYMCYKKFKAVEDKIIRCHTDGVYLNEPLDEIKLGDDLGEIKYEYFSNVSIKYLNSLNKTK